MTTRTEHTSDHHPRTTRTLDGLTEGETLRQIGLVVRIPGGHRVVGGAQHEAFARHEARTASRIYGGSVIVAIDGDDLLTDVTTTTITTKRETAEGKTDRTNVYVDGRWVGWVTRRSSSRWAAHVLATRGCAAGTGTYLGVFGTASIATGAVVAHPQFSAAV